MKNTLKIMFFLTILFEISFAKVSTIVDNNLQSSPDLKKSMKVQSRPDYLPKQYVTPEGHFRIHYTLDGQHAVSDADTLYPNVNYPDWIVETGIAAERSYSILIDSLGFEAPPENNKDGPEYDIYVREFGHTSDYGGTTPEMKINNTDRDHDWYSYIEIDNDYDDGGKYYTNGLEGLRATIAHEFFHMVQLGYNYFDGDVFFLEWSSVWFEDIAYPQVNDYLQYKAFFKNPQESIWSTAGYGRLGFYHYSLGVFLRYFTENYGAELLRKIWDEIKERDALAAMQKIIPKETGKNIPWHINRFYRICYFSGSRYDPDYSLIEDAIYFPDFNYTALDTFSQKDGTNFSSKTNPYGTNIFKLAFTENQYIGIDRKILYNDTLFGGYIEDYYFEKRSVEFSLMEDTFVGETGPEDTLVVFITNSSQNKSMDYSFSISERDKPMLASKIDNIYPNPINPTSGNRLNFVFQTDLRHGSFTANLYNILGERVSKQKYSLRFEKEEYQFPIRSDLSSGVYILKVGSGNKYESKKITILK
ncbi:MAG: T9SS type A sorting domain-containing protein [Candidatus Marinimicrobia bacterium]|nr:T9SS type A sorting domain-containing protein [Candidatus Neomarinimicrobiota bacterium]